MLPRTLDILRQGITQGLHLGAQIYVSHYGKTLSDDGIGQAKPGTAMTADTITLWLSATKPIAAIAIAMLWEQNKLSPADLVVKFIPEFGAGGKDIITIRHLLTHTGGFRSLMNSFTTDSWETTINRICAMKLETKWVPGKKAGYHPATSWFILGELVRRITGQSFDRFVREKIFEPLGCNHSFIGMPTDFYHANVHRIGGMYSTNPSAKRSNTTFESEWECAVVAPGANGRGPIRELARVYEALLPLPPGGGAHDEPTAHKIQHPLTLAATQVSFRGEKWLIAPQTVEAITARHRVGLMDQTFRHVIDWGLGFIIDSKHYNQPTLPYGYGPHASPRTFGHSGNQSSCAFCDPENHLVVAWTCNGQPGEQKHTQRQNAINAAIYEDLKL